MVTTTVFAEKKSRKAALITITFSYGLVGFIVSATTSNEIIFDLTKIGIVGGLLAAFLGFTDPVNKLARFLISRMRPPRSLRWVFEAFTRIESRSTSQIRRIFFQEWVRGSYYSPYLADNRDKIVSEAYFFIGLVIIAAGPFFPFPIVPVSTYIGILILCASIAIIASLFFHCLELMEKACIVVLFEAMIQFGLPLDNLEGLRSLLTTGNWSEACSWMQKELESLP